MEIKEADTEENKKVPTAKFIPIKEFDDVKASETWLASSGESFPRETLSSLIHSLSSVVVGDSDKFSKIMCLLQRAMNEIFCKALRMVGEADGVHAYESRSAFSRDICSVSDRIYNVLGSANRKNQGASFDVGIIRNFESVLLEKIKYVLASGELFDVGICSRIIADYSLVSRPFIEEFVSWIIKEDNRLLFQWSNLFLNSEVSEPRQEQLIALIVFIVPNGASLKIFGNCPSQNLFVKRVFVKKLLIERISQPSLRNECRISKKIANYFASINPALVMETLLKLLQVFSDQSQFLECVNFEQQLQLVIGIIDFAKVLRKADLENLRQDVIQFVIAVIPEYLNLADNSRRQMGMYLVETLSGIFEWIQEGLHFDYAEDNILSELKAIVGEGNEEVSAVPANTSTTQSNSDNNKSKRRVDIRTNILDSDDEEDVDDLESENSDHKFLYLRECLDCLGEKETYANFALALRAIPSLLRKKATGESDLSTELLDRFICLDDRFRMPDLSNLRKEVVTLLFANHPELVSRAVTILFSNQCCMSNRYFILTCIENAARELSNSEHNAGEVAKKLVTEYRPTSKELGNVTWKAAKREPPKSAKNKFLDAATLFVYPLLSVRQQSSTHLDLYDKDHILLGKILFTVGQLVHHAKYAAAMPRIMSSLFTTLHNLRTNKHTFVLTGILFCYASIAEALIVKDSFLAELEDCLEWISELAESGKTEADPNLMSSIETAYRNIADTLGSK